MTPFILMVVGLAMIAFASRRKTGATARPSYAEEMEREAVNMRAKSIAHSHGDPNWWNHMEAARAATKSERIA